MNQILLTETKKKKKKSSEIEIANIIRFFAIVIIIFGITFIGKGSYALYNDSKGRNIENLPTVSIYRVNDTVKIEVNSINIIENLIYSWNDYEDTRIPVGDTHIEEEILLPVENSVLNIKIEDETGRAIKYQKEFIVEGLDITEPEIKEIDNQGNTGNVKITATDETAISYITYKINSEEEVKINKSELESKEISYIVTLPRGQNTIVITAVDESGNIATKEEKIIVSAKTNIRAEVHGSKMYIILEDEDGVKDIEINLNGKLYTQKDVNEKQVRVPLDLIQGANVISVTVTNVNSLVTTVSTQYEHQ